MFSWEGDIDEDRLVYEIFFATSEEGPYEKLCSSRGNWVEWPTGKGIYYKIRTVDCGVYSDFSEVVTPEKW